MDLSAPAALRIAAGALLLIVLLSPGASAQLPPEVSQSLGAAIAINIHCPDNLLEPTYAGQDEVTCTAQDLSRDCLCLPGTGSGTSTRQHYIDFEVRPRPGYENLTGWQVLQPPRIQLDGSEATTFTVNIKATPAITTQGYEFDLIANIDTQSGYGNSTVIPFNAEVQNYDFALLGWSGPQAQKAGQDEIVVFSILVQNTGVYPDSYRFRVDAKPDLRISPPANVFIPAGESRVVNISVLTPHGKLYEMGRSEAIGIKVTSVTGSGVYATTGVLQIRGAYIPVYWVPLLLVGAVSATVLARGEKDRAQLRRLEKGRPRRVGLTPRQEALLAELKRSDPEAYQAKKAALDQVYKERAADYREHRSERVKKDKEEARRARAEFLAQKKAREARRAEEKRAAKLQRRTERREAKLLRKKEKELERTRKVLLKRKAKADKAEAKRAAKQAKLDAKAAAAEQKQAAKAAKDAAKAEKARLKAEKRERGG